MTDATPTRAQRFARVVAPAAERAGYTGHGAGARLARDTGMTESSVSRMLKAQAIPDARFFEPLAKAVGLSVSDLLVEAEIVSPESLRTLSETDRSQVRSRPITPEEAAERLGITDPVGREMLFATIERLKRLEHDDAAGSADDDGGTAARM